MSGFGIGSSGAAIAWSGPLTSKDISTGAPASLAATAIGSAGTPEDTSATRVTLSAVDTTVVYAKPLSLAPTVAWASAPSDEISRLMQGNMKANSNVFWNASSLLGGLGAALLDRFATTQDDFTQSAASYLPDGSRTTGVAAAGGTQALDAAAFAPNTIGLKIRTVSGKEVSISIAFGGDGNAVKNSLSVKVHVDGELTADEQKAIAQLSAGFETALQGLSQIPPTVDLAGLVSYDQSVLSGVDLSVRETPHQGSELQSLEFHADAMQRSLVIENVSSTLSLKVDMSQPEILGTAAQQSVALTSYLERFDEANRRGHGDAILIAQFKAAFTQLNSNYPAADGLSLPLLNVKDRSVLSGLADFTASMSGDFDDGANGGVTTEVGHIEYRAAQRSAIVGHNKYSGLSVTQVESALLKSDFVKSRNGLKLDTSTGNYDTFSIRDESSTTTTFTYAKDKLKKASIEHLVKQLERYQKLVDHKVVEERESPSNEATLQDISARLLPSLKDKRVV